jgi:hypothetical protein
MLPFYYVYLHVYICMSIYIELLNIHKYLCTYGCVYHVHVYMYFIANLPHSELFQGSQCFYFIMCALYVSLVKEVYDNSHTVHITKCMML